MQVNDSLHVKDLDGYLDLFGNYNVYSRSKVIYLAKGLLDGELVQQFGDCEIFCLAPCDEHSIDVIIE